MGFKGNRLNSRDRGYTPGWDKAAATFRKNNPLCLGCWAVGRKVPTAVADHIIPHKGDRALFWNTSNLQPACKWHHDVIKQMLEQRLEAGQASPLDMRLDSDLARVLTTRHPKVTPIGEDGWPAH